MGKGIWVLLFLGSVAVLYLEFSGKMPVVTNISNSLLAWESGDKGTANTGTAPQTTVGGSTDAGASLPKEVK
jgi:hypothetical protein